MRQRKCFGWVVLVATAILAGQAQGQNTNLGPDAGSALNGPNGARISIAKTQFGVDGSGVTLGQIEPNEPLRTHVSLVGGMPAAANVAGVAATSDHATEVAGVMIGRSFTFSPGAPNPDVTINGVATGGTLFSTGLTAGTPDQNYFGDLSWLLGNKTSIINMSFGYVNAARTLPSIPTDGKSPQTLFIDQMVLTSNTVVAIAVHNLGRSGATTTTVPSDAYNAISVGATGGNSVTGVASTDYTQVANYSSRGPTAGGVDSPDIVAPGSLILMPASVGDKGGDATKGAKTSNGTSFATPEVSGVAALLLQHATQMGVSRSELAVKAEILNSASKQVADPSAGGDPSWPVWRAANYNTMVLPDGVTQVNDSQPLNDSMGVGQLNGLAALRQDVVGFNSDIGLQTGTVAANGTSTFNINNGGGQLTPGSLVQATLDWNRVVTLNTPASPSVAGSYASTPLANLNLALVNTTTGDTVAISNSAGAAATGGDNIEHLYINVPTTGNYNLVVQNQSGVATPYGLAWTSGVSSGISFTVDSGTAGVAAIGTNGVTNGAWPNDVNSLGPAGPGNYPVGGELFSSALNGTNQLRISGALQTRSRVGPFNAPPAAQNLLNPANLGVLGMQAGDQMTGLSFGRDGSAGGPTGIQDATLLFSVSTNSQGANNTAVSNQAAAQAQGGAIFKSESFLPFGKYSSARLIPAAQGENQVVYTGAQLGLKSGPQQDNLRDFEMDNVTSYVDPDGDGVNNAPVFFTLSANSPSITKSAGALTPNDIFVEQPQDNNKAFNPDMQKAVFDPFSIYATFAQIGLQAGDVINSLVLSDTGPMGVPDGVVQPFVDMNTPYDTALFTLAPGSPSLAAFQDGSPADVLYTAFNGNFDVYSFYNEMGLSATDSIDGLDIATIPEPVSFALTAGLVVIALRRRRTSRAA